MDRALNIFLRYPEPGRIKTRLAADLGSEFVYALYLNFLRDIFTTAGRVQADVIVSFSSANGVDEKTVSREWGYPALRQEGDDLGERMHNSLKRIFGSGYERCALIGSDAPDLPAGILDESFRLLDESDYVLGPSEDGGYYLVGTRREKLDPLVFQGIRWGTGGVLNETMYAMRRKNHPCALLPGWRDIDDMDGLRDFYIRNRTAGGAPFTMEFLRKSGKFPV